MNSPRTHTIRLPSFVFDMAEDYAHPGWGWVCVALALLSGIVL